MFTSILKSFREYRHVYLNKIYKNILPPLSLLNKDDEKDLIEALKNLNFTNKSFMVA